MAVSDKTLQEALVLALAEMPNPVKNANNPAFKRDGKVLKYADLEATLDACKPILAANGIALMQMPVNGERGEIGVHTVLIGHGEQMDCGTFVLPMEGSTPQKAAGAITYARRYALTTLFGLAQEDDDANAASVPQATAGAAPAASHESSSAYASEKQVKLIHVLAKKAGYDSEALKGMLKVRFKTDDPAKLRKGDASKVIDGLNEAGEKAEKEPPVEEQLEAAGFVELGEEVPF
jgi:hypothetical protein